MVVWKDQLQQKRMDPLSIDGGINGIDRFITMVQTHLSTLTLQMEAHKQLLCDK